MTARLAALADRARRIALARVRPTDDAARPTWYRINTDDAERAIVQLDGVIGWDVVSSSFTRELNAITAPAIDLHINSPGGSVWDGYAIYNAIKTHSAHVTAHIVGVAASAASFIAMAADEVIAYRPSEMMIHDAAGFLDVFAMANPADLARIIAELDELRIALDGTSDEIAGIYARKAGGTVAEWRAAMVATTWYDPDEALASKLVDSIHGDAADAATATTDPPDDGASTTRYHAKARADTLRAKLAQTLSKGVS